MIKLVSFELRTAQRVWLRFSDGTAGEFDFASLLAADTEMTRPLADSNFFASCFLELGALCWPNGLDFSAASLQQRLAEAGRLTRDSVAA